jgi:Uma2 family endonuclease
MASTTATPHPSYDAGTPVTAEEYERIALADPSVKWELHRGRLREKPGMTWNHADVISLLSHLLQSQLSRTAFRVHTDIARLRRSSSTTNYYMPDLVVIPVEMGRDLRERRDRLEVFVDPLPLVVEAWSPSTGGYDMTSKLPEYQRRGDAEIWRLHPYDRTLTAWRRQPDGSYVETVFTVGQVRPAALPNVTIDLDTLFDP